jgi:hypothetical protein
MRTPVRVLLLAHRVERLGRRQILETALHEIISRYGSKTQKRAY